MEENNDRRNLSARERRLDQFKKTLIQLRPVEQVSGIIVDYLKNVVGTNQIGIYTWKEADGAFSVWPETTTAVRHIKVYDPFLIFLTDHDQIFAAEDFAPDVSFPHIREDAVRFFTDTRANHVLPLVLNQSLVGVIFLEIPDEVRPLARETWYEFEEVRSLSVMALSNSILYQRLEGILSHLEEKVQERTRELEAAQSQLVQSEKMAMLGVMVAGIAHEINTPAGVINGGVDNIENNLTFIMGNLHRTVSLFPDDVKRIFFHTMNRIGVALVSRTREIKDAFKRKKALTSAMEKRGFTQARDLSTFLVENGMFDPPGDPDDPAYMESFMSNGLLKDMQTIFAAVSGEDAQLVMKLLGEAGACARNLQNARYSIRAIVRIVRALKYYSHLDQGKMAFSSLHEGLDNTIIILGSLMKGGVKVEKKYGVIPDVECNADELNQVWTNLITNAFQAMKNQPDAEITIETSVVPEGVVVSVRDNGPGIPEAIRGRIWDPFFTTKDQGEGSGLGLGIVKGIVDKHKGRIEVDSITGKGTEFRVILPIRQPDAMDPSPQASQGIFKFR
ncbi:MAG: sensor histidine kinase [Spirochaetia bacterium]|nr:sensor histidine kinase [Spirochaetia bacterium]